MKVLSMYLPQFHRTAENDEWWGEGFTDWVSTKNAKPLFDGHYQPHEPLNDFYYDLTQKETMMWQAKLMHQYGIDGQCIYHYWFSDGKMVLNKPAENLLKWKDINMPFCFCWANETWARSWSNIKGTNTWVNDETKTENGKKILLKQQYGVREDWIQHFNYFLDFFNDSRYIRIDGRPLLVIYKADEIPCLESMIDSFRELAKENGISDLFIIGDLHGERELRGMDARVTIEPSGKSKIIGRVNSKEKIFRVSYDKVWERMLNKKAKKDEIFCGFVSYDDSPRRGNRGIVYEGISPEKFEKYFSKLLAKGIANHVDVTLLNAWNEWGEGMHLEPDKENEYDYLKSVTSAKENTIKYVDDFLTDNNEPEQEEIEEQSKDSEYLDLMDKWMICKENSKPITSWLNKYKIDKVAIYGIGVFGRHLINEIDESEIELLYAIDRNITTHGNVQVFSPDNLPNERTTLIVTSPYYFADIYKDMKSKGFKQIISIKQLIDESLLDIE